MEIDRISKMKYFEDQLEEFLEVNGIPTLDETREEGWIHFVHLYARIVEDCPLVMTPKNSAATIASVTLKMDLAQASKQDGGDMWFKVRWIIEDKNGQSGEIFILNWFSPVPEAGMRMARQPRHQIELERRALGTRMVSPPLTNFSPG